MAKEKKGQAQEYIIDIDSIPFGEIYQGKGDDKKMTDKEAIELAFASSDMILPFDKLMKSDLHPDAAKEGFIKLRDEGYLNNDDQFSRTDIGGRNFFHYAVAQPQIFNLVLNSPTKKENFSSMLNQKDRAGQTPIMTAISVALFEPVTNMIDYIDLTATDTQKNMNYMELVFEQLSYQTAESRDKAGLEKLAYLFINKDISIDGIEEKFSELNDNQKALLQDLKAYQEFKQSPTFTEAEHKLAAFASEQATPKMLEIYATANPITEKDLYLLDSETLKAFQESSDKKTILEQNFKGDNFEKKFNKALEYAKLDHKREINTNSTKKIFVDLCETHAKAGNFKKDEYKKLDPKDKSPLKARLLNEELSKLGIDTQYKEDNKSFSLTKEIRDNKQLNNDQRRHLVKTMRELLPGSIPNENAALKGVTAALKGFKYRLSSVLDFFTPKRNKKTGPTPLSTHSAHESAMADVLTANAEDISLTIPTALANAVKSSIVGDGEQKRVRDLIKGSHVWEGFSKENKKNLLDQLEQHPALTSILLTDSDIIKYQNKDKQTIESKKYRNPELYTKIKEFNDYIQTFKEEGKSAEKDLELPKRLAEFEKEIVEATLREYEAKTEISGRDTTIAAFKEKLASLSPAHDNRRDSYMQAMENPVHPPIGNVRKRSSTVSVSGNKYPPAKPSASPEQGNRGRSNSVV